MNAKFFGCNGIIFLRAAMILLLLSAAVKAESKTPEQDSINQARNEKNDCAICRNTVKMYEKMTRRLIHENDSLQTEIGRKKGLYGKRRN